MTQASPAQAPLIGIDLGTTNSLIAHWDGEEARLIPNSLGEYLTPSVVSIDEAGQVLVGRAAEQRRISHPHWTAAAFKRVIGSQKRFRLGQRDFSPEDLSALVLTSLKHDAEAALGVPVSEAVISVPAYFNDTQRKATKAAAELAGLNVTRLINEPTAAALAFGLAQTDDETRFLVFDLGGGTFDVSIVERFDGVVEVKASTGDNYLGGEDFTLAVADHLSVTWGIATEQLNADGALRNRLHALAERAKLDLSTQGECTLSLQQGETVQSAALSAEQLEALCATLLERLRAPVERALRDTRLNPDALHRVVMVGGATRMPLVRKAVTRMFGRFPDTSIHPDHAVALGAAQQAALVARHSALSEVLMTDVCPYSLGVEVAEEISRTQVMEGLFSPIIERNTTVPTSRSSTYSPMSDGQSQIELKIYQGEHRFVKDNVFLGQLSVPVPPLKRGEVQVEVRFSYDVSGLLEVDAVVPSTGQTHSMTVLGSASALDAQEVAARRAELAKLKIHPRQDMPNQLLLARLERHYAQRVGAERDGIGRALADFTATLQTQDTDQIARTRKHIEQWLAQLEQSPLG